MSVDDILFTKVANRVMTSDVRVRVEDLPSGTCSGLYDTCDISAMSMVAENTWDVVLRYSLEFGVTVGVRNELKSRHMFLPDKLKKGVLRSLC
jgi:hypothetical protein